MASSQYYALWLKALLVMVVCAVVLWSIFLGLRAPINQNNLCSMFRDHPSWYWAALASEHKWGVPISEQMAIMQKESHFRSAAQPPHRLLLGFIPWQRVSSATGYMQALDSTWRSYLKGTHQQSASRESFANATDFIGWYIHQGHQLTGVDRRDAFHNYLIYHEGVGGFRSHSYAAKPWLISLARKVESRAIFYRRQLMRWQKSLPLKPWWRFW